MAESGKKRILAVVGPTASGKSALALELALRLGGEIVSCDSMQVYRGMDIGTAKPTAEDMQRVPHHMIDIADPEEEFTAGDYVARAGEAVEGILARGKLPVFCGGTGLYLDSFLRGGFEETKSDPEVRASLIRDAQELGAAAMHKLLCDIDPDAAAAIHPNNTRRVIRALEIYYTTGKSKTELDALTKDYPDRYDPIIIGLRFSDREKLYRRIDVRVDMMMEAGLLNETRRLLRTGVFERSRTAAQAIGYKELLGHLCGGMTLTAAVDELKKATRRYAKRQMTWFGANPAIEWIDADLHASGEMAGIAVGIRDSRNKNGSDG